MSDAFDDWLIAKIQLLRRGSVVVSGIKRLEQDELTMITLSLNIVEVIQVSWPLDCDCHREIHCGRLQRDVVLYLGQRRYLLNMDFRSKGYVFLSRTLETSAHGSRGWCMKLVAVSDASGVVQNSKGIDIPALLEHNKKTGCIMGFEGAGEMNGDELLVFKCDVLVPARREV